jgi:hypothetical protein
MMAVDEGDVRKLAAFPTAIKIIFSLSSFTHTIPSVPTFPSNLSSLPVSPFFLLP